MNGSDGVMSTKVVFDDILVVTVKMPKTHVSFSFGTEIDPVYLNQ